MAGGGYGSGMLMFKRNRVGNKLKKEKAQEQDNSFKEDVGNYSESDFGLISSSNSGSGFNRFFSSFHIH